MPFALPLLVVVGLVLCLGVAAVGLRLVLGDGVAVRLADDDHADAVARASQARPEPTLFARLGAPLVPGLRGLVAPAALERLARRIDAAGRPHGTSVERHLAQQGAFAVTGALLAGLLTASGQTFLGLTLPVLGWLLPEVLLRAELRERQAAIEDTLPDFVDVLAVTVSAGLGFREGLGRVVDAFDGPLAHEMDRVRREVDFGASQAQALRDLRDRNPSDALSSVVTALLQADELGTAYAESLRTIAADMRRQWEQRARSKASKAAPRISAVVALTFVPASLLFIVGGFLSVNRASFQGIFGG